MLPKHGGADGVLNFCLREFDRIGHERHGLARGVGVELESLGLGGGGG